MSLTHHAPLSISSQLFFSLSQNFRKRRIPSSGIFFAETEKISIKCGKRSLKIKIKQNKKREIRI